MTFRFSVALALILMAIPLRVFGQEADLRLAVPGEMIENGFTKHLLPRFGFKTRIKIVATEDEALADMSFTEAEDSGRSLFQTASGRAIYFKEISTDAEAKDKIAKFVDWLKSDPGKAAIEGFPAGGPPMYVVAAAKIEEKAEVVLEGDTAEGSKLALLHCGRCHVVDERNPFGGIGSTPSFPALRGRIGWSDLFLSFFAENPHPSFTQIEGVTEPFDDSRPSHIAPVELTLDDVEAITAYVATLEPKNLGAGVKAQ